MNLKPEKAYEKSFKQITLSPFPDYFVVYFDYFNF